MTEDEFERVVRKKFANMSSGALMVLMMMGATAYVEDHVMCVACKDRTDAKCPAVDLVNEIIAIANEQGHPEWVA